MADEYVSKCVLTVNGQDLSDFTRFREDERALRRAVNLMNKTGFSKMTPRYGLTLVYQVPASGEEFNFDDVENGTLVVEYDGGKRVLYGGVSSLTVGPGEVDGDSEMEREIAFLATSRREE